MDIMLIRKEGKLGKFGNNWRIETLNQAHLKSLLKIQRVDPKCYSAPPSLFMTFYGEWLVGW